MTTQQWYRAADLPARQGGRGGGCSSDPDADLALGGTSGARADTDGSPHSRAEAVTYVGSTPILAPAITHMGGSNTGRGWDVEMSDQRSAGEGKRLPGLGLSIAVLLTGLLLILLAIAIMVFPPHSDVIGIVVAIVATGAFFVGVGMVSRNGVLVLMAALSGLGLGILGVVNAPDIALGVLGTKTTCEVIGHTTVVKARFEEHTHQVRCADGGDQEILGNGEPIPNGTTAPAVVDQRSLVNPMFEQDRSRNRRYLTLAAGLATLMVTVISLPIGILARRRARRPATAPPQEPDPR